MNNRYQYLGRQLFRYTKLFGVRGPVVMGKLYWLYWRGVSEPTFVKLDDAGGIWLRPTTDLGAFSQVFIDGEYSFDLDFEPTTIIDGGANVGCATLYLSRRFPNAKIIAVEPLASTFEVLERNLEQLPKAMAVNGALWNKSTMVEIEDPLAPPIAIKLQEQSDREGASLVPGWTIEDVMEMAEFESVDLLKLDIEGAEEDLFAGPTEFMNKVRCLVMEFHDAIRPGSEARIRSNLAPYGPFKEIQEGENVVLDRQKV